DGGVARGGRQTEVTAGGSRSCDAELCGRCDGRVDRQAGRQALRRRADRVQCAEGIADAGLCAGLARDQRQAAVVFQEEQAELRAVVELGQVVLEVDAELSAVRRLLGGQPVHRLEIRDVGSTQR